MKKDISSQDIKDRIIRAAMDLIENSSGNIDEITVRAISEKAGIGVGLINYHFQSKENLIETCVQKIIGNVIFAFRPNITEKMNRKEKLKLTAKSVADFLISNPSVSRISILSDFHKPQLNDNTMKTTIGFLSFIRFLEETDQNNKLLAFELTSILQSIFLRKEISKELFGYDFNMKGERDCLIEKIIDQLFMEIK